MAKIIVVDDYIDHAETLRAVLETAGHQAIAASDPTLVLDLVKTESPDLVMSDCNMPKMEGFELITLIKANAATQYVSTLLFSSTENVEEMCKHSLASGADDFIHMPAHRGEILARVQICMERKRTMDLLKEKDEIYKIISNSTIHGFFLADGNARLIEVNDTLCAMLGYSREDLLTKRVSDFEVMDKTPELVQAHILRVIAKGNDQFESQYRRADGSIIDVEVDVNHYPNKGLFLCFIRNVTDNKVLERELIKKVREMEVIDRATMGRELKVVELKKKVLELEKKLKERVV